MLANARRPEKLWLGGRDSNSPRVPAATTLPATPRRVASPTVEETTFRLVVGIVPTLCSNGCLPSTNTVTYGETPRDIFQLPESLEVLRKRCSGTSRHRSNAPLSKRA
jgi:hypothetical protein